MIVKYSQNTENVIETIDFVSGNPISGIEQDSVMSVILESNRANEYARYTTQNSRTSTETAKPASGNAVRLNKDEIDTLAKMLVEIYDDTYTFVSIADTSTDPGSHSADRAWIASVTDTYTNFGSLSVTEGQLIVDNGVTYATAEVDARIDTLEGRLDTAESDIDDLETAETDMKGTGWTDENLVDLDERLDTLNASVATTGSVLKSIKDNAEDATLTSTLITATTIGTGIDELAGTGRTTETVKANADAVALRELLANKKTSLADDSDTYYPSQKAVKTVTDALDTRLDTAETGIVNNTQLIASKDQANLNAHNSMTKRLAVAEAQTYNGTDLENYEPTNEVGIATDGTDISATVEDGSVELTTEGKSFENLLGSAGKGDSLTGWTDLSGELSIENDFFKTEYVTHTQHETYAVTAKSGDVLCFFYEHKTIGTPNMNMTFRTYLDGTQVDVVVAELSVADVALHSETVLITCSGDINEFSFRPYTILTEAGSHYFRNLQIVNLTALNLHTTLTTTALCDSYFNYVDGLRSSLSHDVESVGVQLFNGNGKIVQGLNYGSDGSDIVFATSWLSRDYISVAPSTKYSCSIGLINQYDSNGNHLIRVGSSTVPTTFTTDANCRYVRLSNINQTGFSTLILNLGATALPWQAFKSNYAHVPVTLHQVPTAQDTFDVRTGVHGVNTQTGALGAEKVTNGAFAADTDWGLHTGWTIGSGVASFLDTSTGSLDQSMTITSGKLYVIEFDLTNSVGANIIVLNNSGTVMGSGITGAYKTGLIAGHYKYYFVASGSATGIRIYGNIAGSTFNLDNFSLKEIATTNGSPIATADTDEVIDDGTTAIYELADSSKYTVQYPPQNLVAYKGGQISRIPKLRSNAISVAGTVTMGTIPISRMGDVYEYIGAESSLVDPADITLASDGLSFDVAGGGDDEVYDYVAFYDTSYSTYPTQQVQYCTENLASRLEDAEAELDNYEVVTDGGVDYLQVTY